MPKYKRIKAIAKRFKTTATGKVMHAHSAKSHLLQDKSRKQKRRKGVFEVLDNPALAAKLRPHAR